MTISVITAALNCRQDLIRTRDSVLRQRGVKIQHIVVDGGSTDGTRELLAEWAADEHFRFVSETDTGVYDAFNKGLRLADGDYIGFLNAGDIYHNSDVLSDIALALADAGTDLVFGDVDMTPLDDLATTVRRYRAKNFLPQHLLRGFMPPHPSIYVRRSAFDLVGEFCTEFRIAGDFEWAIRAFMLRKLGSRYLGKIVVRMPVGGISNDGFGSMWRNTIEMHRALRLHALPASWIQLISRLPRKWLSR